MYAVGFCTHNQTSHLIYMYLRTKIWKILEILKYSLKTRSSSYRLNFKPWPFLEAVIPRSFKLKTLLPSLFLHTFSFLSEIGHSTLPEAKKYSGYLGEPFRKRLSVGLDATN